MCVKGVSPIRKLQFLKLVFRSVVKTATLKKVSPKSQNCLFWYDQKDSSCLIGYENPPFWSKHRLSFLSFLHGSNKNRFRRV